MKPFTERLQNEIDRIETAMSNMDLSQVEYDKLARSLDILIKNRELLSGRATSRDEKKYDEQQINDIAERVRNAGRLSGEELPD